VADVTSSLAHRGANSASVVVFVVAALQAVQGRRRVASLEANAVARFRWEPSERSW
jgi:hypothetical protein